VSETPSGVAANSDLIDRVEVAVCCSIPLPKFTVAEQLGFQPIQNIEAPLYDPLLADQKIRIGPDGNRPPPGPDASITVL
jgi:hypothetical protein